ncbi:MAG: Flp pilus assembly protein CpaB [Planctomycetes bacterium]|nr:Flp pilus assembly protein CpaB [Planctomycetota bacterium]
MKRISPGTVTIGVIAILFGLATAYAARQYFAVAPAEEAAAPQQEMANVVIPRINLPKFSRIRSQDVDLVEIPVSQLPAGAVPAKSRALFRLVKTTVLAGSPILEEDLYDVDETPRVTDRLPAGYRAVTIKVSADSAVNGMIQPESLIDVLMTVRGNRPELSGVATMTLLRSVKVLATSENRYRANEDRASRMNNVTLAVTPRQANSLTLAQQYGTLSVTLRGEDSDVTMVSDGDDRDLVNPYDLTGLAPIEPVAASKPKQAEIWRGGSVHKVSFEAEQIRESRDATAALRGINQQPTLAVPVSSQSPVERSLRYTVSVPIEAEQAAEETQ